MLNLLPYKNLQKEPSKIPPLFSHCGSGTHSFASYWPSYSPLATSSAAEVLNDLPNVLKPSSAIPGISDAESADLSKILRHNFNYNDYIYFIDDNYMNITDAYKLTNIKLMLNNIQHNTEYDIIREVI